MQRIARFERRICRSALACALLLLAALPLPAAEPFLQKTNLFTEETDGFRLYRIPGIVVTAKGSALAYCEARKFTVADRGELEIHLRRSTDGGRTWSAPVEITPAFARFRSELDWQVIATGPGHAVQLQSGRLVAPFWMATYAKQPKLKNAVGIIYSDDHGRTWQRGEIALRKAGEPNIAELPDGRVLVTARNADPRNRRMVAYSPNGATGWSKPEFIEELLEPGCMAGIVSHPGMADRKKPFLLFSNPHTTERAHKDRVDVTIKLSEDGGRTWPVSKVLQPGPSAYSDLAVLPDGTMLCFYESGDPDRPDKNGRRWAYSFLTLARFNLDWLTATNSAPKAAQRGIEARKKP